MKTYLGDGVYADYDRGQIILTTENGISVTNTIYLEPDVYESLVLYVDKLKERAYDPDTGIHRGRSKKRMAASPEDGEELVSD